MLLQPLSSIFQGRSGEFIYGRLSFVPLPVPRWRASMLQRSLEERRKNSCFSAGSSQLQGFELLARKQTATGLSLEKACRLPQATISQFHGENKQSHSEANVSREMFRLRISGGDVCENNFDVAPRAAGEMMWDENVRRNVCHLNFDESEQLSRFEIILMSCGGNMNSCG